MKTIKNTMLAAMLVAGVMMSGSAQAEEGFTYGILNMGKVLSEATAAKSLKSDLDGKLKDVEQQLSKKRTELETANRELIKQEAKLSKEDLDKKRKEFQEKIVSYEKDINSRKLSLQKSYSEGMSKLRTEILKSTADIAKAKGLKAVFTDEAMVLAEPEMDITKEVIADLNKDAQKITLTPEKK